MLITDGGQTIRVPVDDIRIAGRSTQGVTVFKTAAGPAAPARKTEGARRGGKRGEGWGAPARGGRAARETARAGRT